MLTIYLFSYIYVVLRLFQLWRNNIRLRGYLCSDKTKGSKGHSMDPIDIGCENIKLSKMTFPEILGTLEFENRKKIKFLTWFAAY